MHERRAALLALLVQLVEQRRTVRMQDDLGAVALHRLHLGARRALRHHDRARRTDAARRPRHRLRVVAGRDRDEPARALLLVQAAHLVQRAARLERSGLLEALALERELEAERRAEDARRE